MEDLQANAQDQEEESHTPMMAVLGVLIASPVRGLESGWFLEGDHLQRVFCEFLSGRRTPRGEAQDRD